ncbi:MAG: SMP-30/gluconolactonase/LRE family protein, partial [Saprospiraceae bacterium]|nr:SMP-30/gluconolactonase/LRE family protein [Candidatus Opimibacter iunctus]
MKDLYLRLPYPYKKGNTFHTKRPANDQRTDEIFIYPALIHPGFAEAQTHHLKFTPVTGQNGVFLGKINDITQDRNGTIWFSDQTNRGITKYDGTRLTRYQNDSRKTNSLGGIYPECLFADSSGMIWVGFYGYGLDRFDPENTVFTHYRHDPNDPQSLANDTVTGVLIDHLHNVWVATYGGLDLLDPATGKFTHFAHDPSDPTSLSWNIIRALYEDREGVIWVGTGLAWHPNQNGGLNRFDRKSGTFTRYLHNPENPNSLSNNKVRAIFEDSEGTFWVGSLGANGLQSLDRKTGNFTTYPTNLQIAGSPGRPPVKDEFDHITFFAEDAEKCLWIGTLSNGICRYNPETKTTSHYTSQSTPANGFKDDSGWTAYASPDGWLWISTQEANLYKVDLYINKFIPDNSIGLPINGMYTENADVVWFATEAGLFRRDFSRGSTQHYPIDPDVPYRSTANQVYDVFADYDETFWLSSPQGLIRFDQKTKATTRYRYNPADDSSISWDDISQVYRDSESNLFVCTYGGGLNLMDTKTGSFLHYVHDEEDSTSLSGNIITSILEDETKDYWIGTWTSGINRMDRKTRRCKRYLAGMTVIDIIKGIDQTIWVGASNGLYRYNRLADSFDPVEIGGVPVSFDELKSMVLDKAGMLWMSTLSGLFKVDTDNDHCIIYGKENGISTSDFYYSSACVRDNGEILFGSALGYYHFYPDKLKMPAVKPHIFLTSFFLKGQLIKPASGNILTEVIGNTREIHLSHDQNVFSFGFTGIDYGADVSKVVYYKLENYDPECRVAGSDGQIYYFNIPPGKYNLRIKAVNSAYGTFDEKNLTIIITPPWYSTWWAYALYALGFI